MDNSYANADPMDQDTPPEQEPGGYCIKIHVAADGRPQSVSVKQKDDDEMEDGAAPPMGMEHEQEGRPDDEGVPVGSIEEAIAMVKQIVQNQGNLPPDQGTEQDQLMAGYGKGSFASQQRGMPLQKVFKGDM